MKNIWLTFVILGSLLLGLSACVATDTDAAAETAVPATTESVEEPTEVSPTAPAEMVESTACDSESDWVFSSEEGSYCFVYPEDYCWLPGQDALTNTFVSVASEDAERNRCPDEPLILHGDVVWVSVVVTPANGQSLAEAIISYTEVPEDFGLEIEEVMLAGETAVQINNMPGQDISRVLFTIHKDQLYQLTFVPAGADRLYEQVTSSFQFLP